VDEKIRRDLQKFALQIRIAATEALKSCGFGHIGGIMSIADVVAVLYGAVLKFDPQIPLWADRDKVVCSKGHAAPALHAALALKGFFPYEELKTLNKPGTRLPSHCDGVKTPGLDMTAGSLGQGTSVAVGMALGDRLNGRQSRTFLIVGDGELNEGQPWEAAMFAAAKKLTNLVWLIDWNKKQLDGPVDKILPQGDLEAKFASFGFDAVTVNGQDVEQLYTVLTRPAGDKPLAVIMDTIKGAGVRELEEMDNCHSVTVGEEVWDRWLAELNGKLENLEKEAAACL